MIFTDYPPRRFLASYKKYCLTLRENSLKPLQDQKLYFPEESSQIIAAVTEILSLIRTDRQTSFYFLVQIIKSSFALHGIVNSHFLFFLFTFDSLFLCKTIAQVIRILLQNDLHNFGKPKARNFCKQFAISLNHPIYI